MFRPSSLRQFIAIITLVIFLLILLLQFSSSFHPLKSHFDLTPPVPSSNSSESNGGSEGAVSQCPAFPKPETKPKPPPCPSIYDTAALPPIDHSKQNCAPIPSRLAEFSTELCYDPDSVCNSFTVRISRTSSEACTELESLPDPSYLPEVTEWMRKQNGPDSFYLRTDGAERKGIVLGAYQGNCRYQFDVQLRNPGAVWLSGWWEQSRYEGFSETNTSWPEMHLDPLFDPVYLNTCSPECAITQAFAPPLNRRVNKPTFSHSYSTPAATIPELPPCTQKGAVSGVWIPTHPLDILYPPYPLPQVIDIPTINRYTFHADGCSWQHGGLRFTGWDSHNGPGADWSPYAPSHAHWSKDHQKREDTDEGESDPNPFRKCLKSPTKLFFIGDSHGRVIFDAVSHRLEQLHQLNQSLANPPEGDPWVPTIMRESEKIGNKFADIGPVSLEFVWDPRGLEFLYDDNRCDKLRGADVVIPSLGSHWANVNQSTFEDEIPRILKSMTDCEQHLDEDKRGKRKYILMPTPAGPQRTDEWARSFKDHRTNLRSLYQNEWSLNLTRQDTHQQWMAVDMFGLTIPFTLEVLSVDLAHYLVNDALEAIIDETLGKAGLCD